MNLIKNILGRIFATWALIVFTGTLLIVVIPIWLTNYFKEPGGTEIFRRISKIWMDVFLFLIGCRIIVRGRAHFAKGQNYVVTSNHNSFMDVPITTPQIPGPNKTIAKIEMARIPLFGIIYKRGSVLVDRKNEASRKESLSKMKQVLQEGMHMCIYPEGTRNKTGKPLKEFHDGAFRLAIDTGKPIMPTLIFNTKKVLPWDKKFFLWPSKMEMHFLEPIPVKPGQTASELKGLVFSVMEHYYEAHAKELA